MKLDASKINEYSNFINENLINTNNSYNDVRDNYKVYEYLKSNAELLRDNPELYTLFLKYKDSALFKGIKVEPESIYNAFNLGIIEFDQMIIWFESDGKNVVDSMPDDIYERGIESERIPVEFWKQKDLSDDIYRKAYLEGKIDFAKLPDNLKQSDLLQIYEERILERIENENIYYKDLWDSISYKTPKITEVFIEYTSSNIGWGERDEYLGLFSEMELSDLAYKELASGLKSVEIALNISSDEVMKEFLIENFDAFDFDNLASNYFSVDSRELLYFDPNTNEYKHPFEHLIDEYMKTDEEFRKKIYIEYVKNGMIDRIPEEDITFEILESFVSSFHYTMDYGYNNFDYEPRGIYEIAKEYITNCSVDGFIKNLSSNDIEAIKFFLTVRPDAVDFLKKFNVSWIATDQYFEEKVYDELPIQIFEDEELVKKLVSDKLEVMDFVGTWRRYDSDLEQLCRVLSPFISLFPKSDKLAKIIVDNYGMDVLEDKVKMKLPSTVMEEHIDDYINLVKSDSSFYNAETFPRQHPKVVEFLYGDNKEEIKNLIEEFSFMKPDPIPDSSFEFLVCKMCNSIGIENARNLLSFRQIPSSIIEKNDLEENEKFLSVFDIKYKIDNGFDLVSSFFKDFDTQIAGMTINGRKARFEIYKRLNNILDVEDDYFYSWGFSEIVEKMEAIFDDIEPKNSLSIRSMFERVAGISYRKKEKEFATRIRGLLEKYSRPEDINSFKVLEDICNKVFQEEFIRRLGDPGDPSANTVDDLIDKELTKTKESGDPYYSPVVISNREVIKTVMYGMLSGNDVFESIPSLLVNAKNKINKLFHYKDGLLIDSSISKNGQTTRVSGWIQLFLKGIDFEKSFTEEEFTVLKDTLVLPYYESVEKTAIVKDGITYEQIVNALKNSYGSFGITNYSLLKELFGDRLTYPFSANLPEYFSRYAEEIIANPDSFQETNKKLDDVLKVRYFKRLFENGLLTPNKFYNLDSLNDDRNDELSVYSSKNGISLIGNGLSRAREAWQETKNRKVSNIPQFDGGKAIKKGEYTYIGRMLRADDILNLLAGQMTDCCQVFDDVAGMAADHASRSKNGGIFVVEKLDKEGNRSLIAQSWTWRNGDVLCFDNIELPKGEFAPSPESYERDIIEEIYRQSAKNALMLDEKMLTKLLKEGRISEDEYNGIVLKKVTVGTGNNEIFNEDLNRKEIDINPESPPKDYFEIQGLSGHTDSSQQVVLARNDNFDNKRTNTYEDFDIGYRNKRQVRKIPSTEIFEEANDLLFNAHPELESSDIYGFNDYYVSLGLNPSDTTLYTSYDKDWYAICQEDDNSLYIAEVKKDNNIEDSNTNEIVQLELKLHMYQAMINAAIANHKIVINSKVQEDGFELDELKSISKLSNEDESIVVNPNVKELQLLVKKLLDKYEKLKEEHQNESGTIGKIVKSER